MRSPTIYSLTRLVGKAPAERYFRGIVRSLPWYDEAEITLSTVQLDEVSPIVSAVYRQRLTRAEALLHTLLNEDITPYDPIAIQIGENWRLISPPVVEIAETPFVAHGSHRSLVAYRAGIPCITAICVSPRHTIPAPCRLTTWDTITTESGTYPWTERMSDIQWQWFRPIVSTPSLNELTFSTLDDLVHSIGANDED